MLELVTFIVGLEITKRLQEIEALERMEEAQTEEARQAIINEMNKVGFEVVDDVFKSESEIGEEGIEVKNEFLKNVIAHNYIYFNYDNPFENGATLEQIKVDCGHVTMK